jgi:tripartite-type tricarboxylate transporter receptor subunit TctC
MRIARWLAVPVVVWIAFAAHAQTYPVRPVRIIVPFAPGGATDIVTRVIAPRVTDIWGQTVVVDNRGGAAGNIGAELAAKATPDGYTLFMPSGSVVTANQHIYRKISFNAEKDFVAITNVASGPQIVAVANNVAAKDLKELIALAKAKPRALTFGSAGVGSQTHLAAENFLYTAGIDAVHIPFKGEGPALTDLVGGQIQLLTPNLSASIGFVTAGRIRALAVTSRQRSAQVPNVPAVSETLPGFENLGWFGLVAPAGTPKAVIDKVHRDVVTVLGRAEVRKRFEELGMAPVGNTPAEFAKAIREESVRWARVIRERKLQID